jgi:DNA-binding MarR family transcriptional regulator
MGLSLLLEQTARSIYDKRGPADIHPGQWSALRYYARANRKARTVAGLATFLGVTRGPASRATASLVKQGFLSSEVNEQDRRSPLFTVTDKAVEALQLDPILRLASAISELGTKQRAALTESLEQLYTSLKR